MVPSSYTHRVVTGGKGKVELCSLFSYVKSVDMDPYLTTVFNITQIGTYNIIKDKKHLLKSICRCNQQYEVAVKVPSHDLYLNKCKL